MKREADARVVKFLREGSGRGFGLPDLKKKLSDAGFTRRDIDLAVSEERVRKSPRKKSVRRAIERPSPRIVKRETVKRARGKTVKKVEIKVKRRKISVKKRSVSRKRISAKKSSKKKIAVKESESGFALTEALKDLEKEIRNLNRDRVELKKEGQEASANIEMSKAQERAMHQKIAGMVEHQARLNQKRKSLQMRIERDAHKISKIVKIKSEISDI